MYHHLLIEPWPPLAVVVALAAVLTRWRLRSPWQLVDVSLGALAAALAGGVFALSWSMPWLDAQTGVELTWKAPLYVVAGLALGLSLPPVTAGPTSMLPGLALGAVLVRGRLTDPDVWVSGELWPCVPLGVLWLVRELTGPGLVLRVGGTLLGMATPAIVAAQVGMGRLTALITMSALVLATLRRRGR